MAGFFRRILNRFKREPKPQMPQPPSQTPKPQQPYRFTPKPEYAKGLEKVQVDERLKELAQRAKKPLSAEEITDALKDSEEEPSQEARQLKPRSGSADEVDRIHEAREFPDYAAGWKASTHLKEAFENAGKTLGFKSIDEMFNHYERVLFSPNDPRHKAAVNFVRARLAAVAKQGKRPSPQTKGRIMGSLAAGLAKEDLKRKTASGG